MQATRFNILVAPRATRENVRVKVKIQGYNWITSIVCNEYYDDDDDDVHKCVKSGLNFLVLKIFFFF